MHHALICAADDLICGMSLTSIEMCDWLLQVSCGARHTVVRTSSGQAFAWGWNKYGQLGLQHFETQSLPHDMHPDGAVLQVACGWWHSTLLVKQAVNQ